MAEFPDIGSLSYDQLQRLTKDPSFRDAGRLYRNRVFTRLRDLEQQQRPLRFEQETADVLARVREENAREQERIGQSAQRAQAIAEGRELPPIPPPPPPPPPPAPPPEAIREVLPEPRLPPPSGGDGRSGSIPSGAAGIPPSTLFPPLEKFGDPAQRRAQVETALENRMKEIGDYKAPEKSILDSPYAAILQAGLGMLMGGTGKSPLEAIAAGGREGLQSAKEIAQRQEARAEKEYGRKVERVKLKSAIEKEMFDITAKEDDLRAKFQELEILRARGISADQIGRMEAALKAQYQTIQERKLDLMEDRYGTQDRASRISALQKQNELAQKELKTALDAGDNARATSIRNAIRVRENQINDLQGTQPPSRANPNQAIPPPR
jgi:hypothetical protein